MNRRDYLVLIPAWLALTAYLLLTLHHPFFWDTIQLSSEHAHWFLENNFKTLLLPDFMDSGHIPFMGFYLALCWKVFGYSLAVAHLSMLPWILGIALQLWILVKRFIPPSLQIVSFLVLLVDPTLFSQLGLISPDVLLVFFFLLALNALLSGNRLVLSLALTGLVLSSLRGMMVSAALFAFQLLYTCKKWDLKLLFVAAIKNLVIWLPAMIIVTGYLGFHYLEKGWIGYHGNSPWAESFQIVSINGMIRNLLLVGWRMIDFGRIFLWITCILILIRYFRLKIFSSPKVTPLLWLWIFLFLAMVPSIIIHKSLTNHRYLIPLYLITASIVLVILSEIPIRNTWKRIIPILLIFALVTGNLWRYPDGVATGWDSSLAHWPWFKIRQEAMLQMKIQKIDPGTVGTEFPELSLQKFIETGNNNSRFAELDTVTNKYVFWSNIMNGFPVKDLDHIQKNWTRISEWSCFGVKAGLYKNPGY